MLLMDSSLEGQYEKEDATKLVELASRCLQSEARDRPDTKFLLTEVAPLQKHREVNFKMIVHIYTNSISLNFCELPKVGLIVLSFVLCSGGISCSNGTA